MLLAGAVDLESVLASLAIRRPVFHSEADFQVALAWEVQKVDPLMDVFLETRPARGLHLDLAFERPDLNRYSAVELKYLTRFWTGLVGAQLYELKNHSAQDNGRYGIVKDIWRIEKFVEGRPGANGAVVALTNDPSYWKPSERPMANDLAFRVDEGAHLEGRRAWARPSSSTASKPDLELQATYNLRWSDYSMFGDDGRLRQLVVEVAEGVGPKG